MADDGSKDSIDRRARAKQVYDLAGKLFEGSKFEDAIKQYSQAIEIDPTYTSAYFNRALSYAILSKYAEAREDARKVMELEPNTADTPYVMGIIEEYQKNYGQALQWYQLALTRKPDFAQAKARAEQLKSNFMGTIAATSATGANKSEEEKKTFLDSLYEKGNGLFRQNKFEEAIAYYTAVIDMNRTYFGAYFYRAMCYSAVGKFLDAKWDVQEVGRLKPNSPEQSYLLGVTAEDANNYDVAKDCYSHALELDGEYKLAKDRLASLENKMKTAPKLPPIKLGKLEEGQTYIEPEKVTDVSFEKIVDLENVKEELDRDIIYPLLNPELAKEYGVRAGGGILLYGPPGCGKSFIVRAAAGEAKVTFVNVRLADILNSYVGNTERNIRNAFKVARGNAPTILFFDEIDTLGGARGVEMSERWMRSAVDAFLMEIDDLIHSDDNVLLIGATNVPWLVDSAIKRSGRLGNFLYVPAPNTETRVELFRMYLKGKPLEENIDYKKLADMTDLRTSADIAAICGDATKAVYQESFRSGAKRKVTMEDIVKSVDKKKPTLSEWYQIAKGAIGVEEAKDLYADLFDAIAEYEGKKGGASTSYR